MGDCAKNCKRRDQIAAVDSESSPVSSSKKMKLQIAAIPVEFNSPSHQLPQDRRLSAALSPDKTASPVISSNCGGVTAGVVCSGDSVSCRCFSIESDSLPKDSFRSVDLEAKSFETEGLTCIDTKSRETNCLTGVHGVAGEMESPAKEENKRCRKKLPAKEIPNQEEIEEFFAEAEKEQQKRFADKYNFDVVKDVPLEGRYQWVPLKP